VADGLKTGENHVNSENASASPARDPRQPADFEPVPLAKALLRRIRAGALGTLDSESGGPLSTLATVATDSDGAPLILTSRLSYHTGNLLADPRFSLLLSERGKGDPLAHPRLSLMGKARIVERETEEGQRFRRRFLARHPKAELYIDFPDFLFWRLEPSSGHLNGGFARAWSGTAESFLTQTAGAEELIGIEEGAIEHMNADHAEAVQLYATGLLGLAEARWRCTGIDPDGLDMMAGEETARLAFPARVITGAGLRLMLKQLADQARGQQGG
jgi:heme iron utilization protein